MACPGRIATTAFAIGECISFETQTQSEAERERLRLACFTRQLAQRWRAHRPLQPRDIEPCSRSLNVREAAGPRGDFRSSGRSMLPLSGEANAYRSWMDRAQSSQPIRTPGERTGASSVSVPVRGNHAEFRQKIHLSLVSKFPEPALLDQSLHFPRSRRAVQTVHQLVAFTSPCYAPK
jgi:hypothetical protein